jgi:hypothetical protein
MPTSMLMNPTASGMIGQVATAPIVVIDGHTLPDAKVVLRLGKVERVGRSDSAGDFEFRVDVPAGSYHARLKVRDETGQTSSALMPITKGDAVVAWIDTMVDVIKADIANVGLASRTLAMVSGAVYDAVKSIDHMGSAYKFEVQAPAGASASAAASAAADKVLSSLDPIMLPLLDARMAQSMAAVPSATAATEGAAVGDQIGQDMLAWRANDGSAATVPYVPGTGPGQWRPTPPTYQAAWGPEWGQVTPFAITKPAASFMAPPPPALDSREYAAAYNQVKSLGAVNSTTRTPEETQIGMFWSYDAPSTGTPPVHFDQIAATVALLEHNSLDQNARLFGLVNLGMADAGIAAWDNKYTYNRWRPVTAIDDGDSDGNPATKGDPTWMPLGAPGAPGQPNFTPAFPSYVSGHATFGSTLFDLLTDFYGTNNVHFTLTSDMLPGVTRSYDSFSQASYENAMSRIYLGLHFWFDETAGMTMGKEIATDVFDNVLTPNAT